MTKKYYEVTEPYYALIKADSKEEAIEEYVKSVAENEDGEVDESIEEVEKEYALALFGQCKTEDGELLPPDKVLEEFNDQKSRVLAFDGALI
ncbi:hypothetical protein P4637_03315 [Halalkalibacterium halodurans]|uniref:hypothetical protein n=1 Tax=Halalkalibacterium halodurans TaxID=86665 RepID=UPI002E210350|nr:hypothetical protein [Halalkalibacterium halodurans]MED4105528.1 hypothetical protein [Halalkalibacterium halodurans]MED4109266.1 hypothetical protein [Halalkalibacterium halodurans]MED4149720.1 hypothetical protein [Halalkalibacterium halodurans]